MSFAQNGGQRERNANGAPINRTRDPNGERIRSNGMAVRGKENKSPPRAGGQRTRLDLQWKRWRVCSGRMQRELESKLYSLKKHKSRD